jgi:hypothetical protein
MGRTIGGVAAMEFLLISGMLVCAWVFLCVLSGERERRSREIELQLQIDGRRPADHPHEVDKPKN